MGWWRGKEEQSKRVERRERELKASGEEPACVGVFVRVCENSHCAGSWTSRQWAA